MMFKKIKFFIEYFKFLNNPIDALKFKFGLSDSCHVKIKGVDNQLDINDVFILNKLMTRLPLTPEHKRSDLADYIQDLINDEEYVVINGIKFVNVYNEGFIKNSNHEYEVCYEEYFTDDDWNMIDFNDRFVIDIGANVADTALDFAKKGAKVVAFEPVKHLYELGLKNMSLNSHLEDNIILVNRAVGAKRGMLDLDANSLKNYVDKTENYSIEVITIPDVLNDWNFPPDVLKMDCEGCEFEIVMEEDLTMFNDVIFEHHSELAGKDANPLIEKLTSDGFKIDTYLCNATTKSFDKIGIIHAYK